MIDKETKIKIINELSDIIERYDDPETEYIHGVKTIEVYQTEIEAVRFVMKTIVNEIRQEKVKMSILSDMNKAFIG